MEDDGLYSNYRLTARLELKNVAGTFAQVATLLAKENVNIGAVDIVQATRENIIRDVTFDARNEEHGRPINSMKSTLSRVFLTSVLSSLYQRPSNGRLTAPVWPVNDP